MDKQIRTSIDCACVIHDTLYSWEYVERLFNGLQRNLSIPVHMHVYTEAERRVPDYVTKHPLQEWDNVRGPKQSWWYKLQMFNTDLYSGELLYFDLDTVIVDNIDWIWKLPTENYFWALKDFQYLYRNVTKINSSVMWFDNRLWADLYKDININRVQTASKHYGDQDYIYANVPHHRIRYLDPHRINSWRWQAHNGGWDFKKRCSKMPGSGTTLNKDVSILVFHGNPKPHEIKDALVQKLWC